MVNSAIGCFPSCWGSWNPVGLLGGEDVLLQLIEPMAGAGVHQQVADLDDHATEQRGVQRHLQVDRVAGQVGQRVAEVPLLVVAHCVGGGHPGHPPAAGLGRVLDQCVQRGHDVAGPAAPGGVGGQAGSGRQRLATEELAEDVLIERLGCGGRRAGGGDGQSAPHPPERRDQLAGRHHRNGLMDQAGHLVTGLALEQSVEHGATGGHRHRAVVDGQEKGVVPFHDVGEGVQLRAGVDQTAVGGQRLLHGGQVALEGWVHRAPPAPAAAPVVSVRTAAMASLMRSWWSAALISRPMTRSAAARTISPTRAVTSSTAAWRATTTSASAEDTIRSWTAWPSAVAPETIWSAVDCAWATISRAWVRACSSTERRSASASSASALALSAASSSPRICSWRSVSAAFSTGSTYLAMTPSTMMNAIRTTMNVPLGTRKLLVAIGMVVILGRSEEPPDRSARAPRATGRVARTGGVHLPSENTKSAAKTRLMKYAASQRPTVRNMIVVRRPWASG